MRSGSATHLSSVKNLGDVLCYGSFIFHSLMSPDIFGSTSALLLSASLFLGWLRAFVDLRAFEVTQFPVRFTIEAFKRAFPYALIIGLSFAAFLLIFTVMQTGSTGGVSLLLEKGIASFVSNVVSDDERSVAQAFSMAYVMQVFLCMFFPVIFVSTLIAIVNDTFDQLNHQKIALGYREKCALILELEQLMFWNRNLHELKYLHVVKYRGTSVLRSDTWEGTVNLMREDTARKMEAFLSSQRKQFLSEIETMEGKLRDEFKNLKGEMGEIQKRLRVQP